MEDYGRYQVEELGVETLPMVDAPVILFAGRTVQDVFLPPLLGLVFIWMTGWIVPGALLALVLVWGMPVLRERYGRGQLQQMAWSYGWPAPKPFQLFTLRDKTTRRGP